MSRLWEAATSEVQMSKHDGILLLLRALICGLDVDPDLDDPDWIASLIRETEW